MSLFDLLARVADELPGCQSTSIVNKETGLALVSVPKGDPDAAAGADAFHADLYRLTGTAMNELGSQQDVANIVVQGQTAVFISQPINGGDYFWHVVTATSTTLGFTQAVMRKHRDEIESGVRGLLEG